MDFNTQEKEKKGERTMSEQEKLERKIERLIKKAVETKVLINKSQESLDLIYGKLRDLNVTKKKVDNFGEITEKTKETKKTDLVGIANEVGQEVIDRHTTTSVSNPFYMLTIDKKYYETH